MFMPLLQVRGTNPARQSATLQNSDRSVWDSEHFRLDRICHQACVCPNARVEAANLAGWAKTPVQITGYDVESCLGRRPKPPNYRNFRVQRHIASGGAGSLLPTTSFTAETCIADPGPAGFDFGFGLNGTL
jgi:hypothetical protein